MAGEYTAASINVSGSGSIGGSGGGGGGGMFGVATIANALVGVVQSIESGRVSMAQSRYNAALLEGKIKWINFQKGLASAKWDRARGKFMSRSFATMASNGLMPSGSPMAVLLDSVTQINIDKAIEMSNIEQEKVYTQTAVEQQLLEGRNAVRSARVNAYSSVLKGATNYGMYQGLAK